MRYVIIKERPQYSIYYARDGRSLRPLLNNRFNAKNNVCHIPIGRGHGSEMIIPSLETLISQFIEHANLTGKFDNREFQKLITQYYHTSSKK